MKKFLFIISLVFCLGIKSYSRNCDIRLNSSECFARPDTNIAILDSILSLNLSYYVGKPVDSLLHHLPVTDSVMRIATADNPYTARRFVIVYQNWYSVEIVIDNFQFMNPVSIQKQWDIGQAKKETIAKIEVYQGNICVYGCN